MATNTYVALDKITVGTATPSITFSSISGSYTDLVLVMDLGAGTAGVDIYCQVNGDTASNYSHTRITGNGTAASSSRGTSLAYMRFSDGGSPQTTANSVTQVSFMNYSNTTTYKTALNRASNGNRGTDGVVNLWRSTAAITSITVYLSSGNITAGSTFSLYGIKKEPQFSSKATGGTILYGSDGYIYHTFTSSGTFTPNQTLTCQTLVVGGGGGGGAFNAGVGWGNGGNGGNVTYSSSASYNATGYTVTIGSGGSGGTGSSGASGGSGTASSVNSITAAGAGMASGPGYGVGGTISTYRNSPAAGIGVEYLGYKVAGGGWYGQNGQNIANYPINSTQYGGGFQKGFTSASPSTSPYNGGGGAGGSNTSDGGTYAGQSGASGLVVIRYAV